MIEVFENDISVSSDETSHRSFSRSYRYQIKKIEGTNRMQFRKLVSVTRHLFLVFVAVAILPVAAFAQENAEETYTEIEQAFGFVPTFMREYPEHGIRGAWILTRDMELSEETALSPKVKSLINIAVGAQIPCHYCVFADTQAAIAAGATEEEIKEAVGQAALTRHWSTMLNGLQIDFEDFKAEFSAE